MSDKVELTIDVTLEERQHIETLALEHGFASPGDYLLSLIQDEMTKAELLTEFRESVREAANDQIIPAANFLSALEDDD